MWTVLLASLALAAPAGPMAERLAEIEPLRAQRAADGVPDIPPKAYAEAAGGDVVTGTESVEGYAAHKAWGVGVFDVPIARYWAAINDDPGKLEHSSLEYQAILEGGRCAPERLVFQYLPITLASDRWWVADIAANLALNDKSGAAVREMIWKSSDRDVSDHPEAGAWASDGLRVEFTEGAWFLVDLGDGRTLVEYYAWSDPGGRIPARLASRFAAGSITDTLQAMARLAEAGPGCPIE